MIESCIVMRIFIMCTLHEMLLELYQEASNGQNMLYAYRILVLRSPVTTAWRVLRLRMVNTASRCGGQLRIY
jgi:hypothetical protein